MVLYFPSSPFWMGPYGSYPIPSPLLYIKGILCHLIYRPVDLQSEKAMAPHSSTLAWTISWMEEPGRLQSMGSLRVRHYWVTSLSLSLSCIWEGNGNPLQCSCLENPRDRGVWWVAVYGVSKSRTWLKRLSSSRSSSLSGRGCLLWPVRSLGKLC